VSLERFSERNTAFNAVSRDMGVPWQGVFHNRVLNLVRDGKMEPKREFEDADEALLYYAYGIGFETVNETTVSWGSGKSNRGALTWEQPRDISPEVLAQRPTDGKRLRRYLGEFASRVGALRTGVAELRPEWIYADVQRNHCSSDAPEVTPIHITEAAAPYEDETGLYLPSSMKRVIVMAVPMDFDLIMTAPSLQAEAATSLGYSRAAAAAISVATFIRTCGYQAIPSVNGTGLSVPMAIAAGIGQAGRNGLLITPEAGACVRLCKVFTDMPLELDTPIDLGVTEYCQSCGLCAEKCPSKAVPTGDRTVCGPNECSHSGELRWYVNAKQCLRYWVASGTSCSVCIAVCPFTRQGQVAKQSLG